MTPAEPCRDLTASHAARTTASRVEHGQWIKDHPNFSSQELLENWRHIREAWGLVTHTPAGRAK